MVKDLDSSAEEDTLRRANGKIRTDILQGRGRYLNERTLDKLNRFERLQGNLGIPLPASTQWDLVHAKSKIIKPALDELIRQAAQGDVVHNNDTNSYILAFLGQRAQKAAAEKAAAEKSTPY